MTNTIVKFPVANRVPCAWIRTGNPRQPLACVWIDADRRRLTASDAIPPTFHSRGYVCAPRTRISKHRSRFPRGGLLARQNF